MLALTLVAWAPAPAPVVPPAAPPTAQVVQLAQAQGQRPAPRPWYFNEQSQQYQRDFDQQDRDRANALQQQQQTDRMYEQQRQQLDRGGAALPDMHSTFGSGGGGFHGSSTQLPNDQGLEEGLYLGG